MVPSYSRDIRYNRIPIEFYDGESCAEDPPGPLPRGQHQARAGRWKSNFIIINVSLGTAFFNHLLYSKKSRSQIATSIDSACSAYYGETSM